MVLGMILGETFKYEVAQIIDTTGVFLLNLKSPVQQVTHTLYMVTDSTRSKGMFQGRSGTRKTEWNQHVHWEGIKVYLEPGLEAEGQDSSGCQKTQEAAVFSGREMT